MTYFEFYFNSKGVKTLRRYSQPINLTRFDDDWMVSEENLDQVFEALCDAKHFEILSAKNIHAVNTVDENLLEIGLMGVDESQYSY